MDNSKIMKYHVKQSSRTSSEEDRLSSLPDAIITDILSRLPTNSAAATSVLSHRWSHLWTGITRIELRELKSTALIDTVLQRLTSQKLHKFVLYAFVGDLSNYLESRTESWFRSPTTLVKAHIDLSYEESDPELSEDYLYRMNKFVGRMSSVYDLELKLSSATNILANLHLEASLCLLPSNTRVTEQRSWCAPDSVPVCLISKLETIQISGLKGVEDDLWLLGYFLSNAVVLKKLVVRSGAAHVKVAKENGEDQKECQFCRLLLNLPRSSSTCEVVSGWYTRESLTCRKLHEFSLDVTELSDYPEPTATTSWFREVFSRDVEDIQVTAAYDKYFFIPALLFNSRSLVSLALWGVLEILKIEDLCFNLPNLKRLNLNKLKDVPLWLETLITSCPLLEDLDLGFNLDLNSHLSSYAVIIVGSNLESLTIRLLAESSSKKWHLRVSIDAPKLSYLYIEDGNSIYTFIRNPTTLVDAHIRLLNDDSYWLYFDDEEEDNDLLHVQQEEYIRQMAKFVRGMSSVTYLELKLQS
uniref:FBD domain-containing protein n=1 Tax=Chenopodium quinoa TaxID=63459 RepID=A0A803MF10_CHEQI